MRSIYSTLVSLARHHNISELHQSIISRIQGNAADLANRFNSILALVIGLAMLASIPFSIAIPALLTLWILQALEIWFLYEQLPDTRSIIANLVVVITSNYLPRLSAFVIPVAVFFLPAQQNSLTVDKIPKDEDKKHPIKHAITRALLHASLSVTVVATAAYSLYTSIIVLSAGVISIPAISTLVILSVVSAHTLNILPRFASKSLIDLSGQLLLAMAIFGYQLDFSPLSIVLSLMIAYTINMNSSFALLVNNVVHLLAHTLQTLAVTWKRATHRLPSLIIPSIPVPSDWNKYLPSSFILRVPYRILSRSLRFITAVANALIMSTNSILSGRITTVLVQYESPRVPNHTPATTAKTDYPSWQYQLSDKALSTSGNVDIASLPIPQHSLNTQTVLERTKRYLEDNELMEYTKMVFYTSDRQTEQTYRTIFRQAQKNLDRIESYSEGYVKEECQIASKLYVNELEKALGDSNHSRIIAMLSLFAGLPECPEGVHHQLYGKLLSEQPTKEIATMFLNTIDTDKQQWVDQIYGEISDCVEGVRKLQGLNTEAYAEAMFNNKLYREILSCSDSDAYNGYQGAQFGVFIGILIDVFQNTSTTSSSKEHDLAVSPNANTIEEYQEQHSKNALLWMIKSAVTAHSTRLASLDNVVRSHLPVVPEMLVPKYGLQKCLMNFLTKDDNYVEKTLYNIARNTEFDDIKEDITAHLTKELAKGADYFKEKYSDILSIEAVKVTGDDYASRDDLEPEHYIQSVLGFLSQESSALNDLKTTLRKLHTKEVEEKEVLNKALKCHNTNGFRASYGPFLSPHLPQGFTLRRREQNPEEPLQDTRETLSNDELEALLARAQQHRRKEKLSVFRANYRHLLVREAEARACLIDNTNVIRVEDYDSEIAKIQDHELYDVLHTQLKTQRYLPTIMCDILLSHGYLMHNQLESITLKMRLKQCYTHFKDAIAQLIHTLFRATIDAFKIAAGLTLSPFLLLQKLYNNIFMPTVKRLWMHCSRPLYYTSRAVIRFFVHDLLYRSIFLPPLKFVGRRFTNTPKLPTYMPTCKKTIGTRPEKSSQLSNKTSTNPPSKPEQPHSDTPSTGFGMAAALGCS